MIPLIRNGEPPKNPMLVQKPMEANSIAAGRPATEDISFTGQKLPPLPLAALPRFVARTNGLREEFELIFGADV